MGGFLDHFMLTPHSELTKVYDVPCKAITVAIDGVGVAANSGTVDVLIYGQNLEIRTAWNSVPDR